MSEKYAFLLHCYVVEMRTLGAFTIYIDKMTGVGGLPNVNGGR